MATTVHQIRLAGHHGVVPAEPRDPLLGNRGLLRDCFRTGTYYVLRRPGRRTNYVFLFLDNGEGRQTMDPAYLAGQMWRLYRQAAHERDILILMMPVPYRDGWFFRELFSPLGKEAQVALLIAGHRHSDGIEEIRLGGRRVTQVRTASLAAANSNWRRFRPREDGIQVSLTAEPGRVTRIIPISKEQRQ